LTLLALGAVSPLRAEVLTLGQALDQALVRNTTIGRAQAGLKVAEAEKKGTLAAILPQVNLKGYFARNTTEITYELQGTDVLLLPRDDWNGSITLEQPIFAGLREQKAYRQSKLAVDQAREGVRGTEDSILLKVATDYLNIVESDAVVEIEKKNLDLAKKRQKQADDFYEAGESTKADALRALADVKRAERRLTSVERDREVAASALRVDIGLEGPVAVEDPGTIGLPMPAEPDLVTAALLSRPELAQAQGNVNVAELEIAKQKGAYLPTVTAEASYIRQKINFPTDRYGYAKVNVTVPVFDSGETAAHVAVARGQLKDAQLALEDLRLRVREDVHTALLDLDTAHKSLSLAEEQERASGAEYDQTFEQYRNQEATSLDVGTAEAGLADARRAVAAGRIDVAVGELKVWYAVGSLKAAVLKEVHP
jgi:outer membrane protein